MKDMEKQAVTRSKRRKYRVSIGLCSNCPRKSIEGKSVCQYHMDKMAENYKKRSVKRKATGICRLCKNKTVNGTTMCQKHLDDLKLRRKRRLDNGLCAYCGLTSPTGKTICGECSESRKKVAAQKTSTGLCVSLGCKNAVNDGKKNCRPCCDKRSKRLKELKQIVLDHYGQKCNCSCGCTVTNIKHLTIDHINGDGAEQRKKRNSHGGHANYRNIIKDGFPKDLQVLCWNCNCAKEYQGGCT